MKRMKIQRLLLTILLTLSSASSALASSNAPLLSNANETLVAAPDPLAAESCVDDVWLINARRGLPSCCSMEPMPLPVEQYIGPCHWERRTLADVFTSTDHPQGTIVYVHGNRVSSSLARSEGVKIYRTLRQQACGQGSFRLIIFSWPSDQIHGQLQDVRVKAARTAPAAYVLSQVLTQLPADEPVGLVGYSFGSRIITGSLHLLAGGQVGCFSLGDAEKVPRPNNRVVLIASAVHSHWLGAGQCHGLAITQIDRLLLLNNSCDSALKRYRHIERCSNPSALGYVGLNEHRLLEHGAAIEQVNACCTVGRSHSLSNYLCNSNLMSRVWSSLSLASDESAAADADLLLPAAQPDVSFAVSE